MAFEFFFGLFGLISSDSESRHKSRLESEWRLSSPLNASLFREAGLRSPPLASFGKGGATVGSGSGELQRPIFSTSGTLASAAAAGAHSNSASEALFSSASSSSASSVASSGSTLTANSSSAFIKPSGTSGGGGVAGGQSQAAAGQSTGELPKKYEFYQAAGNGLLNSKLMGGASSKGASHSSLVGRSTDDLLVGSSGKLTGSDEDPAETGSQQEQSAGSEAAKSRMKRLRSIYCGCICLFLWLHVVRLLVGLLVERSLVTLDFYCLGSFRIHFLIPALCLAIQAAAVSLIFIRNNDETNWLVPFYSSKDYLIRSRSNFKPKMEDYTRRVNISVALALLLALVSSCSLSAYIVHCVGRAGALGPERVGVAGAGTQSAASAIAGPQVPATAAAKVQQHQPQSNQQQQQQTLVAANTLESWALSCLLVMDVIWVVYSTYICFLVSFYFNLICSIMKSRFHSISKIIEDLAESSTTKTTNQARKITTLYLEHNEACELLDESNDFWQYLIFFTYFTYIPAYCYCLYNLFFVDFEAWPSFITWVIHTHTGFIILLISFSAAGVSAEVSVQCLSVSV